MAYRKLTLRRLPETTRKVARLIAALDSVTRKAKNLLPELDRLEHDSKTLANHRCQVPPDCYWRVGDTCYRFLEAVKPCGRQYVKCANWTARD